MIYDYYPYRTSYYSTPRYYTSYVPSYFVGDRYYNAYRYYRPLYISPLSYARTRAYLPYIPSTEYKYTTYTSADRVTPLGRMMSPIYPEGVRYDYTYGMDFNSATQGIRASADKLLQDIRTPSTRYTRAVSLEPTYNTDLDYYSTRRAMSRARMMSEEPLTRRITTTRCYYI
ncbi:hypothetical protein Bhyg_08912 [Pseudolycoriella hygida]|uniref:Uncharacterized protein n=1 Tax=Pseudolycoriella hygida TaxID=35572 RepID=A0A9Q0S3E5_9DIPT|nr:hypothetical protein Bhyg_08912 [Pseudolycoriella hygida]